MGTAVITTRTKWEEPPRIRHEVARQLARFFTVLYVETPTDWRTRYDTAVDLVERNIYRCKISNRAVLPVKIQHYLPFVHSAVEKKLFIDLVKVIHAYTEQPLVLFNFNYDSIRIMDSGLFSLKVYFCNDDFLSPISNVMSRRIVAKKQNAVALKADICFGVSYSLVEMLSNVNPNSRLFLPGHEFKTNGLNYSEKNITKKNRIKVAYMGYINHHLDYDWLNYASAVPEFEIHLVGPVDDINPSHLEALRLNKNVTFHEAKYHDELQKFLESMDVLTIPYLLSLKQMHQLVVPNKLYKYLAVGKPVIISDMRNFISYERGILYRANTREEFVNQIFAAFSEDSDELQKKRLEIANNNTWDKKGNELYEIIQGALNKKGIVLN